MKSRIAHVLAALLLAIQPACMDSIDPVSAQTAELQAIQGLLQQVLTRLDTLEAREARRSTEVLARLDTLEGAVAPGAVPAQVLALLDTLDARDARRSDTVRAELDTLATFVMQPTPIASGGVQLEAQLCFERSRGLTGEAESKVQVDGEGTGTVGVDAYGNGAKGTVVGTARQVAQVKPKAQWDFKGIICGKAYGELSPPAASGAAAPADLSALRGILEGMLDAVSGDALATVATATDITGSRMSSALNSVSGLSMSQFAFGRGAASDLVSSLPLPADLATLLEDPSSILSRAVEAGQYAIDRLCSQTLFTGDFAERAQQACDRRNDLPVNRVVDIVQDLEGLPATVSELGSDLASIGLDVGSACGGVNSMRTRVLTVGSHSVTFPLGIGTVETFPGFSRALFPGMDAVCQ
jgi:hypothetical protein